MSSWSTLLDGYDPIYAALVREHEYIGRAVHSHVLAYSFIDFFNTLPYLIEFIIIAFMLALPVSILFLFYHSILSPLFSKVIRLWRHI